MYGVLAVPIFLGVRTSSLPRVRACQYHCHCHSLPAAHWPSRHPRNASPSLGTSPAWRCNASQQVSKSLAAVGQLAWTPCLLHMLVIHKSLFVAWCLDTYLLP